MRHGFLLIDKPIGPTSHDAVSIVRKRLGERDIGHIGTLDPEASGLLVLAVGSKALKVVELFAGLSKEYEADVTFGYVSSTYDAAGVTEKVEIKPGWSVPDISLLKRTIDDRFTGLIKQIPPAHSAIHINGKRAYELARSGKQPDMQPRDVLIERCSIIAYDYPHLKLDIGCGSGTYIRSLAHDLGFLLRCGAYLSGLRRTRVGDWMVSAAVQPDAAKWSDVIPLKDVLIKFNRLDLSDQDALDVGHGKFIDRAIQEEAIGWHDGYPIAILIPTEKNGKIMVRPRKVF